MSFFSSSSSSSDVGNVGGEVVVWHLCQPFLELRDFVRLACANKALHVVCKTVSVDLSCEEEKAFFKYLSLQALVDMRKAWPKFHRLTVLDYEAHYRYSSATSKECGKLLKTLSPIVRTFRIDLTNEKPLEVQALGRSILQDMPNLTRLSLIASTKSSMRKVYLFLSEFSMSEAGESLPLFCPLSLPLPLPLPPLSPPPAQLSELILRFDTDLPAQFKVAYLPSSSSSSSLAYFKTRVTFLRITFQDMHRLASPTVTSSLTRFISGAFDSLTILELKGATLWEFLPSQPLPFTLVKLTIVDLANDTFENTKTKKKKKKKKTPETAAHRSGAGEEESEEEEEEEKAAVSFFPWALPLLEEFSLAVPDREIDPCWQRLLAMKLPLLSRLTLLLNIEGEKKHSHYFRVLCQEEMERLKCLSELNLTNSCYATDLGEDLKPNVVEFGGFCSTSLKRLTLISEADTFFRVTNLHVPCLVEYEGPYTDCFFCSLPSVAAVVTSLERLYFNFSEECVPASPVPHPYFPSPLVVVSTPTASSSSSSSSSSADLFSSPEAEEKEEAAEMGMGVESVFLYQQLSVSLPNIFVLQTNRLQTLVMQQTQHNNNIRTRQLANFVLTKCTQNQPFLTHVTLINFDFTNYNYFETTTTPSNTTPPPTVAGHKKKEDEKEEKENAVAALNNPANALKLAAASIESLNLASPHITSAEMMVILSPLENLRTLRIFQCNSLSKGLCEGGFFPSSLTSLCLDTLPYLKSLAGLEHLPRLSSLSIIQCENVKSLEQLPCSVRYFKWYYVPIETFSLECFLLAHPHYRYYQQPEREEEEKEIIPLLRLLPRQQEKEKVEEEEEENKQTWNFASVDIRIHARQRDKTKKNNNNNDTTTTTTKRILKQCNQFRLFYPQTVFTFSFLP